MINVYLLNDDFTLDIDNQFVSVDNKMVYKENGENNFFTNINYVLSSNTSITYCILVNDTELVNSVEFADKNYDFLIDKNYEMFLNLTENYRFPTLSCDHYLSVIYNYERYHKWYWSYFKHNVDLLNLINMFSIIQNVPIKFYIGFEENTDSFVKKLKSYFTMLFGKYNIDFNVVIFYDLLYDCLVNNRKIISLSELSSLFFNNKIEISFIDDLYSNELYKNTLFKNSNDTIYFILNEYTILALLIYYYCKIYIFKIYHLILHHNKAYDHLIYDIILMKQIFMNSLCPIKIHEYLTLGILVHYEKSWNKIKNIQLLLNNLKYDIVAQDEIVIKKYNKYLDMSNLQSFINNKYKINIKQ